jgi:hypothetical protein
MSEKEVLVFREGPLHLELPCHRVIGHIKLREQPHSIVDVYSVEDGEVALVEMLHYQYRIVRYIWIGEELLRVYRLFMLTLERDRVDTMRLSAEF